MSTFNIDTIADRVRQLVIQEFINPARKRGETRVTVKSGDVHSRLSLHEQHANVCRALKQLNVANVKLKDVMGKTPGANTCFIYEI
jgi:5-methylcytosine-specific restriction protein B